MVTVFTKDVIKTEFEPRARRSQRECNAFKLAVVGEVSCGKLSLQASPASLRHPGAKRGAELVLSPCYASRALSERWVYFFHLHPNLVKDGPKPTALNQSWVSDISCLLTPAKARAYPSLLTDAFPRRIVSHYVHANLHMADCLAALYRAARGVGRAATRCIHYSGVVPFGVASTPQIHLLGGAEKGRTALLDDRRP